MKKPLLVIFTGFFLFFSVSVSGAKEPAAPLPPLLEVGQRRVSLEQFKREIVEAYPDISTLPVADQIQLKTRQVQELIDRELVAAEAVRLNVEISPDELDAALAEVRGQYSREEFDQFLDQQGKSRDRWIAALRQRLLTAKVTAALVDQQPAIEDKELENYYRQHKEDFRRPLEVRARQMLFSSREDALRVAKQLKNGGDFATLAQQFSLSPDRENGGNLGYFAKGMLPREFDDTIFRLSVGQISDPVKSPYGFHLFLVERRRQAGIRPYAAVKDEIYELLKQRQEEEVFHHWLETIRQSTRITVNFDLLRPVEK